MSIHHALQLALASQPLAGRVCQGSEAILGAHLIASLRREQSQSRALLVLEDAPEFRRDAPADRGGVVGPLQLLWSSAVGLLG
jgi:hypothetical protein